MPELPEGRDVHRQSTVALSTALLIIGLALIIRTLLAGGGVGALGILLGVLFVAAGAGRLWIVRKSKKPR
ncbi:MAG: hypothetical protein JWP17_3349 [Solirubrobacterales bacterium]|jgi:hypothetical protein|nr:hypothetical protein [Solirubrobacterales bacterium]